MPKPIEDPKVLATQKTYPRLAYFQARRLGELIETRENLRNLMEAWVTAPASDARTGIIGASLTPVTGFRVEIGDHYFVEALCGVLKLIEEDIERYGVSPPPMRLKGRP